MDEKITAAQRKKLFAVIRELDFSQDILYSYIDQDAGKEHVSDLTKREAATLIDKLVSLQGNRKGMATNRQLWKIDSLSQELGWNEKSLMKFVEKYAKVSHMRWLTKTSASAIITGLGNIAKPKKRGGDDLQVDAK